MFWKRWAGRQLLQEAGIAVIEYIGMAALVIAIVAGIVAYMDQGGGSRAIGETAAQSLQNLINSLESGD